MHRPPFILSGAPSLLGICFVEIADWSFLAGLFDPYQCDGDCGDLSLT